MLHKLQTIFSGRVACTYMLLFLVSKYLFQETVAFPVAFNGSDCYIYNIITRHFFRSVFLL